MTSITSSQMLEKLVAFDTTSWKSNMALIDFIRNYLAGEGIESHLFFNDERNKANLWATIGPAEVPGIILSGHTDVVPVDGQEWASDPFVVTERDGKFYGRGTSDMKGFIACVLAAVPAFAKSNLKEPIHLAFSYDEEIGCTGCMSMIEYVRDMPVKPRACIVGEPTNMKVVNSHKGLSTLITKVRGEEAHASTDRGVNAIYYASRMIGFLDDLRRELKGRAPEVEGFDPPYTTLEVGTISGGAAPNITPAHCQFEWEFRTVPGTDPEEILHRLEEFVRKELLPEMGPGKEGTERVVTNYTSRVPALLPETGSSAETLVLALANSNETGKVSYGTEAGHFQATGGIPTVICGPGSIIQAHRPDEFIEPGELAACDDFLQKLRAVVST
ncbi:acetylornithine deacetylase [Emcibacter sp.]|uniref:acetylornithine deacetylase n=1 Tax=Emcibacter sp. TaxID=1979954 RepID=UPI002AA66B27|nr:acetylornithine deacetylase [Emcibacter sp.]